MLNFVVRKLFYAGTILFGVVTVVFFLFNATSENAARSMAGQNATPEMIENIKKDMGLDLPLYKQYFLYLNDISFVSIHNNENEESRIYLDTGKYDYMTLIPMGSKSMVLKKPYLRRSYKTNRDVTDILWQAMPGTIILATVSILMATLIGIFLGIVAALNKGNFLDNAALVFAVLGMSGPTYFTAIMISWIGSYVWYEATFIPEIPIWMAFIGMLFGILFNPLLWNKRVSRFSWNSFFSFTIKGFGAGWVIWVILLSFGGLTGNEPLGWSAWYFELPGTGLDGEGKLWDIDDFGNEFFNPRNMILPAITLGVRPLAIVLQLMRNSLLDVLDQDYIRTARSKGLSMYMVVIKHALKNSLIPVITAVSGWFAALLAGAIFVEQIFNWDGIGLQVYSAIVNEDLPIVMGSVLVISAFFVLINMAVDIIYGFLDPRIRLK